MKVISIILLSLFISSFLVAKIPENTKSVQEQTVIICTGKYAKRYHKSMCRGMKNCKGDAKKISLSEAKKKKYTPCGYCYKK